MMLDCQSAKGATASVSNSGQSAPKFSPVPDSYTGPRPLTYGELCALLKVSSRTSIYRFQQKIADFPKPYKIGEKHAVFDADEVAQWLERQKAARSAMESAPTSEEPTTRKRGGVRKTLVMA